MVGEFILTELLPIFATSWWNTDAWVTLQSFIEIPKQIVHITVIIYWLYWIFSNLKKVYSSGECIFLQATTSLQKCQDSVRFSYHMKYILPSIISSESMILVVLFVLVEVYKVFQEHVLKKTQRSWRVNFHGTGALILESKLIWSEK